MPFRNFLSRSREQRNTSDTKRTRKVLADKSPNIEPTNRPRLRRVQAFSDLNKPVPSTSRTVSVTVKKKAWLKEAVAMTRCMSMMDDDKENIDPLAHQPAADSTASEFSFVNEVFHVTPQRTGSVLRHQRKSSDLRSEYSGKTSQDSGEDSDISMSSFETPTRESNVHCVCRQSIESSYGDMVACDVCKERCHLGCVGQSHRDLGFFEENVFFCPGCEHVAFRKVAALGQ